MSKKYLLKVNDTYEFNTDAGSLQALDVAVRSEKDCHVIESDKTYRIHCLETNFSKKEYKISVNGNKYDVLIQDDLDQLIKELGLTINGKQKDSNLKAPMPGLILEISVSEGQEVKEGDALLVLEAMKMENVLTAPKDGVIQAIIVKKGDAVEKKQLLIEMQ